MSDVEKIIELAKAMNPDVTFTPEAAEKIVGVPSIFRKMAIGGILRMADEEGTTVITAEKMDEYNKKRNG